jgi:hypothetical protein
MIFVVLQQDNTRNFIVPAHGNPSFPSGDPPQAFSSKLLGSFKLPKFDGAAKSWKAWERSFQRFLGFHQLDHVLEEDFPSLLWVTPGAKAANKMVFFLVEDAVATGTLASKLVRQATKWDGHGAFIILRNGYVFNGPQTATILLAELSKIRLQRDEDASTFCLRLVELIEDLELVPGEAAVYLTDTQKLGYLLSAIRHESGLQSVYSQLQSEQLRGTITFDQACRELHHRVESMKADDLLDSRSGRALISSEGKKKGQQVVSLDKVACLAKDCSELIQPYLPLCKLCYLQCMAGKVAILTLRDNLGNAVFNPVTKRLDFPSTVPQSRFPRKNMKKGKALMVVTPLCRIIDTSRPSQQNKGCTLLSSTALVSFCPLPVTAGQEGRLIGDQGALNHTLPVTAGQEGGWIGKKELASCQSGQRGGRMESHQILRIYQDSSHGDSTHGFWATPQNLISRSLTNQDDCCVSVIPEIPSDVSEIDPIAAPSVNSLEEGLLGANHGEDQNESFRSPNVRLLVSTGCESLLFYVDSGAGQCLCSNDSSFVDMTPCMVEITGIAGALQIYGSGTAMFLAQDVSGRSFVLRVHNCLFGRGQFNLLSVSQLCQKQGNEVNLSLDSPTLTLRTSGPKKRSILFPLHVDEGLFGFKVVPFTTDDSRFPSLPKIDVTPSGEFLLSDDGLHRWNSKILASSTPAARILLSSADYEWNLQSFCGNFLAPPSVPPSRRQYDAESQQDLSELSIRLMGIGNERLKHTIQISKGLSSPASKLGDRVPPLNFPQGYLREGKTPRVHKGQIGHIHSAKVGEVVFTDTLQSGDSKYRYGQAYFDYASHWGDVFPLRSRTEVGLSFADFCCRNWVPLFLVRDNIGENVGGSLIEECRKRNVKSAYICPRHPQQNYAEGYIGRVTAMASFAMVYSGAPLFMWIYAIRSAVFVGNIAASFYPKHSVWATPYELVHNEPFPDASIIVPFGCAALVLRDSDDRPKFTNRCTMMVFAHYADEHPLFTYALYSPRTKRVVHRQDVIFLTSIFPMRHARVGTGLGPDGDKLLVFRSPLSVREGCEDDLSFGTWETTDALPVHDDDITTFGIDAPYHDLLDIPVACEGVPVDVPCHPSFPLSGVVVPIRSGPIPFVGPRQKTLHLSDREPVIADLPVPRAEDSPCLDVHPGIGESAPAPDVVPARRPVSQRWTYEPVAPADASLPALPKRRSKPPDRLGMATKTLVLGPSILQASSPTPPPGTGESPSISASSGRAGAPPLGPLFPSSFRSFPVLRDSSGPPPPPHSHRIDGLDMDIGQRFSIRLLFPERSFPTMIFPVATGMQVAQLRLEISELVEAVNLVYLLVGGTSWDHDILEHSGTITDRVFPGTIVPCPYLQQGSRVLVYLARPDSEPFLPPVPVPIGRSSLDLVPAAGGWGSNPLPSPLLAQQSSSSGTEEHGMRGEPDLSSIADSSRDNKRPRLLEQSDGDESSSPTSPPYSPSSTPDNPEVSRRERAALVKLFRKERRVSRRRYQLSVRTDWEAEIADDKENEHEEGKASLPTPPIDPEDEAEAFENYLFDRLAAYDADSACQLAQFRSSLRIVPERLGGPSHEQRYDRTAALWEGLRRVYFGEDEPEPVGEDQPLVSHEQIMLNLRQEIAELEERAERQRRAMDPGRPPLPMLRENDDDDPPPFSFAHTNVVPDARNGRLVAFSSVPETPPPTETSPNDEMDSSGPAPTLFASTVRKLALISTRVLRRILAAKESIFKFGTFVPKNDREADSSPEAARWKAGRDLEWLRLGLQGTFDGTWDWDKVNSAFPEYKRAEVGYLFYVYDFKFSGEHRVRLVFDGSRQSANTFSETYAPTVRAESVRLFHIACVEEGYEIGQYDVPQAFLKADIDHDIFAYPPRGQAEFPGQVLKLRRALYGGKQSAYLWFQMMNTFLLELGFQSSPLDSCFYRRSDALLILYCDDLRIGATPGVLASLHSSLLDRFEVTTAPGDRFLGMDTRYALQDGILKLSMTSYIVMTFERFQAFDLSQGYPFRELVGCLLWITLCVMGPELLRVKDLARRSNCFGESDYQDGLKVLKRIYDRRDHGIVIYRHAAGKEIVPASSRSPVSPADLTVAPDDMGDAISPTENELTQQSLCKSRGVVIGENQPKSVSYAVRDVEGLDLHRVCLPVNPRYSMVVFGDASFAVGDSKQSVTGYVIFLNGVPLLWGSIKQTIVVDSSCSAEFVAASVACKQLIHAENMVGFLGFSCPKPYRMYTDSMACLHIASNPARLGNVRHLQIRYHLVRCFVSLGDVTMFYCITEDMVADLLTKIVSGAQDRRLSLRFYSLYPGSDKMVLLGFLLH